MKMKCLSYKLVFVRLVDQTTGCFNTTTLDLIVKDSPQIVAPDPIVAL